MPAWLTAAQHAIIAAACDRLIPPDEASPGAAAAGVADYIDGFLGAFSFDPPRIWAGGPFSGRKGGDAGFEHFLPLSAMEELAWRTRIEGSLGIAEREFNGPVIGLHALYAGGLASLGDDFAGCSADEQDARLAAAPDFRALLYTHACEGMYGDPAYGGNRECTGWVSIGFPGDSQPRGYTDEEVAGRE